VVITQDEVAAGGEFLDGNSPLSVDQVAEALSELARLHAATWMDRRWKDTPWLKARLGRAVEAWGERRTLEITTANLEGPNGAAVPDDVRGAGDLLAAHRRLSDKAPVPSSIGWCVIHGDAHVGNIIVDAAQRPRLVDWQLVQRGFWQVDVGFLIGATLTRPQRRRCERDLLRHYLDSLSQRGITPPPFEVAWTLLADGMIHGFFLWAITTKVAPDVIAVLLGRLGSAVADHSLEGER
jgi:Ser/Thr protein kinase RdoA (MazF antagonist)